MKVDLLGREAASRMGVKQWMLTLLSLALLLNVLLALIVLIRGNDQRVILVPPTIQKTFWVQNGQVSREYLMQMGEFLAQLYFDVTPANVDFNHKTLLTYVHPKFYSALQTTAGGYAERMKTDNSSSFLAVSGMHVDELGSRIAIDGMLNTYVGDQRISNVPKTYLFEFSFNSGRMLLTDIKETNEKDPFGTAAVK